MFVTKWNNFILKLERYDKVLHLYILLYDLTNRWIYYFLIA